MVLLILLVGGCVHQSTEIKLTSEQKRKNAKQSVIIHTELAGQYYSRGQYKIAIEEAEIALKTDPEYALAYNVLGLIYMALDQNEIAQYNFGKAFSFSPRNSEINNNYGWFLCQHRPEKMDGAIELFEAALNNPLYETPEKAYSNIGICELKRHNYKMATASFQEAILISPMYSMALVGLIEVDYRQGNLAEAKAKLVQFNTHSVPTPGSLALSILISRDVGNIHAEESYKFQLQKNFPDSREAMDLRHGRME